MAVRRRQVTDHFPGGQRGQIATVSALVLVGVLSLVLGRDRPVCDAGTVSLDVVVDPGFAPVATAAARSLGERPRLGDKCLAVRLHPEPAVRMRSLLSGTQRPDVWIPDSTAQRTLVTQGLDVKLPRSSPSLATSPTVIATSRSTAEQRLNWPSATIRWSTLERLASDGQGSTVSVPDPELSTPGLAALAGVRASQPGERIDAGLRSTFALLTSAPQTVDNPLAKGDLAAPTSEHLVIEHNDAEALAELVALYPEDGALPSNYPFVVLGTGDKAKAAAALRTTFASSAVRAALAQHGYRSPSGKPLFRLRTDGLDRTVQEPPQPLSAAESAALVRAWRQATD